MFARMPCSKSNVPRRRGTRKSLRARGRSASGDLNIVSRVTGQQQGHLSGMSAFVPRYAGMRRIPNKNH